MLNFFKFVDGLYNSADGLGSPVLQPFDEGASSIGVPTWSGASVFSPPVFSPPVFSPPVFSPPVFSPPVFTSPTTTPPVTTPPVAPPVGTPPNPPPSPSPFTIAITWDPSVDAAPLAFTTDIIAAVLYLETEFTNPVTINIHVGYKEINGQPMASNDLGESQPYYVPVSYAALRSAVASNARTATDSSVAASLPAVTPVAGRHQRVEHERGWRFPPPGAAEEIEMRAVVFGMIG